MILNPRLRGGDDRLNQSNASIFGSECNGGHADLTVIRAENDGVLKPICRTQNWPRRRVHCTRPSRWSAKQDCNQVRPWFVTGASGGVGSIALQLCRLRGARVIAIASKAKEDLLLELGAEAVIDRQVPDLELSSAYPWRTLLSR